MPDNEGIVRFKLALGEVGKKGGEPNTGEPNAGGRKADVLEDSLGRLELNDDRRLFTSIIQTFHSDSLQFFPTTAVMILFLVVVGTVAP